MTESKYTPTCHCHKGPTVFQVLELQIISNFQVYLVCIWAFPAIKGMDESQVRFESWFWFLEVFDSTTNPFPVMSAVSASLLFHCFAHVIPTEFLFLSYVRKWPFAGIFIFLYKRIADYWTWGLWLKHCLHPWPPFDNDIIYGFPACLCCMHLREVGSSHMSSQC